MNLVDFLGRLSGFKVVEQVDTLNVSPEELAAAIHATNNLGKGARFGAAYCTCQEKSDAIFTWLRQRGATP